MTADLAPLKVYLAGKIGHTDWRHAVVAGLRNVNDAFEALFDSDLTAPTRTPNLVTNGPFFISDDHGCGHGANQHGVDAQAKSCCIDGMEDSRSPRSARARRRQVFHINELRIARCDVVFAFLDGPDPIGTLIELGAARLLRKPIFLAFKETFDRGDYWYAEEAADEVYVVNDVHEAWRLFERFVSRRFKIVEPAL